MSANLRDSFRPRLLVFGLLAAVMCLGAQQVTLGDDRDGSAPRRYAETNPDRGHAVDRGPAAPAVPDDTLSDDRLAGKPAKSKRLQLIAADTATTSAANSSPGGTVSNGAAQTIVVPGESAAATDSSGKPAPAVTLNPQDEMQRLAARAIEISSRRQLKAGFHTPWQIVHGILAYRWDFRLKKADDSGTVSAIEYLMGGAMHKGLPLWHETPYGGRGQPFTEPYAFEGHPTQFMGYMSMANIPLDYEVVTPTRTVRIRDIVNDAKMQVRVGPEITWTLWALAHYEEPDSTWVNAYGEPWSIERLVQMQIDEPVYRAACGGTHGLFALAYARNMYLSTGKPLTGVWIHADQKIKMYIAQQQALQNADGSFSTNYFIGPGHSTDFATRVRTSGHQMEWLMVALPQSRLKEEWIQRGLRSVAQDLIDNAKTEADCGPLFHAVHSLVLYRQRTIPGQLIPRRNSHLKLADRTSPYVPEPRKPRTINVAQPNPVTESTAGDPKPGETKPDDLKPGKDQKPVDQKPSELSKTEPKPADMPPAVDSPTTVQPKPDSSSPAPIASGEKKVSENKPGDAPGSLTPGNPTPGNLTPGILSPGKSPTRTSRTAAVPPERLPSGLNLGPRKPRSQMTPQDGVPRPGDAKTDDTKSGDTKSDDKTTGSRKPNDAKPSVSKPVKSGEAPKGTSDSKGTNSSDAGPSGTQSEKNEIPIKPAPTGSTSTDDSPVKLEPPTESKSSNTQTETTDAVSDDSSPPGSAPVQPSSSAGEPTPAVPSTTAPAPASPVPATAETPQPSPVPPPAK